MQMFPNPWTSVVCFCLEFLRDSQGLLVFLVAFTSQISSQPTADVVKLNTVGFHNINSNLEGSLSSSFSFSLSLVYSWTLALLFFSLLYSCLCLLLSLSSSPRQLWDILVFVLDSRVVWESRSPSHYHTRGEEVHWRCNRRVCIIS